MGDEPTEPTEPTDPIDLTDDDAVRRIMAERRIDPVRALGVLVGTIVGRHVDRELRRAGRRPPYPGQDRPDAFVAAFDALWEAKHVNARVAAEQAADGMETDPAVSDEAFISGLVCGDLARIQEALLELLTTRQFAAYREAGLDEDDEDDGPHLRLVRD